MSPRPPQDQRPTCSECGDYTDDDGECGDCGNCGWPCCTHVSDDPEGLCCPDTACGWPLPDGTRCDAGRHECEHQKLRIAQHHGTGCGYLPDPEVVS